MLGVPCGALQESAAGIRADGSGRAPTSAWYTGGGALPGPPPLTVAEYCWLAAPRFCESGVAVRPAAGIAMKEISMWRSQ